MDKPFIGQMDRKIVVSSVTLTRNEVGEQRATEEVVISPFAYRKELSAGEDVEGKIRLLFSRSYTIRYNATVAQKRNNLIVLDGSDKMKVEAVKEIGRKSHLELLCNYYE
ncbi:MAG: hypothetical protein CMP76_17235 [Flavobacterium sp.]|uniref:hypothetical protein n=1 Tax=Flavobacterium sp. TaxID=239 RepID=UPI000C49A42D|nr:hypothetical protein [Flavobacterium sp.]MBF05023.1 hypothetical protein [Flavobacterium sp.]